MPRTPSECCAGCSSPPPARPAAPRPLRPPCSSPTPRGYGLHWQTRSARPTEPAAAARETSWRGYAAVAAGDAPPGSLPCVTAVAEECALVAAQQRLALAVALFAGGSRLKRRGFVRESPFVPGSLLPGLAAVLSAAELYDVLAGAEDQPMPPPGTAVGMMPALAPVAVAERAAAEGGWGWQASQVRAEVARLRAELGV